MLSRPARLGLTGPTCIVSLLAAAPAVAQCPDYSTSPRWVGTADTSGSPDDIAIVGDHAYAAWGTGFAVFDLANPTRPTLVGQTAIPGGWARSVAVTGSTACLAFGVGLSVVDISNPAHPVLVGSVDTYGRNPLDVVASGPHAYVADGTYGAAVIDVSDPAAPKLLQGVDPPGFSYAVDLKDTDLYVATGETGLWIFTFTNPTRPGVVGHIDTPGDVRSVDVVGDYAFVTDGAGLQVIDIFDRAAPALVASVSTEQSGFTHSVTVDGDYAYVAGDRGLTMVDVSNPRAPVVLGWAAVSARAVAVSGTHAYVGGYGLEVFDVSHPGSTSIAYAELFLGCMIDIDLEGSFAYVTEGYYDDSGCDPSLHVVDVGDPSGPRLVGTLRLGSEPGQVAVANGYAYVVGEDGLRICDVNDPAQPRLAGSLNFAPWVGCVAVSGTLAYVTDFDTLHVVDVSNPSAPIMLGGVGFIHYARALVVRDAYAYVTAGNQLVVIDITNPSAPTVVDSIGVGGALVGAGSYLYACDPQAGFVAIDITDPAAPAVVGLVPGRFYDVAVHGDFACVTNNYGLVLLDISNPAAPVVTGAYPGMWQPVAADGSSLCVARDGGSFCVLPAPCGTTPVSVTDLNAVATTAGIELRWHATDAFVGFDVRRAGAESPWVWTSLGAAVRMHSGWEFIDAAVEPERSYVYRIEGQLVDGDVAEFGPVGARALPGLGLVLEPVRPLPARGAMQLCYSLPAAASVRLEIFDARGRRVRFLASGHNDAGRHTVAWDGTDGNGLPAASGLYFVRLSSPAGSRVVRAAFLR